MEIRMVVVATLVGILIADILMGLSYPEAFGSSMSVVAKIFVLGPPIVFLLYLNTRVVVAIVQGLVWEEGSRTE